MADNFITIDGLKTKVEIEDSKLSDENEIISFFRDEEKIPLNKLTKYYLNLKSAAEFLCYFKANTVLI